MSAAVNTSAESMCSGIHAAHAPVIPSELLIEHVLPYLDRRTYDSFRCVSKELRRFSRTVGPPWPQTVFDMPSGVTAVAFSPSGDTLAAGCDNGSVRLVLGDDGTRIDLPGHSAKIHGVCFSPDSRYLATGSADSTIRIWDLSYILPKDEHGASATRDSNSVNNRDNRQSSCIVIQGANGPVKSLSFDPSGSVLASSSDAETVVRLWNVLDGGSIGDIKHTEDLESVAFSPCGQLLASATWDGRIELWNISADSGSIVPVQRHLGKALPSSQLKFTNDGKYLDCLKGFRVRRWNLSDGTCRTLTGRRVRMRVCSVAMSPDSRTLAYGESNGAIHLSTVSDVISDAAIRRSIARQHDKKCVFAFTPNSRTLAAGGADGKLSLWET